MNKKDEILNEIKFLSDEEIKNANFFELAIYLQHLNIIDNYVTAKIRGDANE